jgi:hypothetical protein
VGSDVFRRRRAPATQERETGRDLLILRTWGAGVLRPYAERPKSEPAPSKRREKTERNPEGRPKAAPTKCEEKREDQDNPKMTNLKIGHYK